MSVFPFVFTVLLLLLGPFRLVGTFANLTRGADRRYKRAAALRATLLAAAICVVLLLLARNLVDRYRLSMASLEISGGLVLLLSALRIIFQKPAERALPAVRPTPMQLAISPLATPVIVSPVAVAALVIFDVFEERFPGVVPALAASLSIVLVLDFLAMFFVDRVVSIPGLMPTLQLIGAVLIYIQVALGIDTMLSGLSALGLIKV